MLSHGASSYSGLDASCWLWLKLFPPVNHPYVVFGFFLFGETHSCCTLPRGNASERWIMEHREAEDTVFHPLHTCSQHPPGLETELMGVMTHQFIWYLRRHPARACWGHRTILLGGTDKSGLILQWPGTDAVEARWHDMKLAQLANVLSFFEF